MKLINVDAIQSQSLETAFNGRAQMGGSCVVCPLVRTWALPSALGRNHESFRVRIQGVGNQFFTNIWTIRIGGINKIHVQLDGTTQNRDRSIAISRSAPDTLAGEAHGSEAKPIDRKLSA